MKRGNHQIFGGAFDEHIEGHGAGCEPRGELLPSSATHHREGFLAAASHGGNQTRRGSKVVACAVRDDNVVLD